MTVTLSNLAKATKQQVFNQIKIHLLSQNKKSISNGDCAYRGEEGLKCAAGCLISDEEYNPNFDAIGGDWGLLVNRINASDNCEDLILDLQKMHDIKTPENWPGELKKIAKKHEVGYNGMFVKN